MTGATGAGGLPVLGLLALGYWRWDCWRWDGGRRFGLGIGNRPG